MVVNKICLLSAYFIWHFSEQNKRSIFSQKAASCDQHPVHAADNNNSKKVTTGKGIVLQQDGGVVHKVAFPGHWRQMSSVLSSINHKSH